MEQKIVNTAFKNLNRLTGVKGDFTNVNTHGLDGKANLYFDNGNETFFVKVNKEVRNHQLGLLFEWANKYRNFLVIAETIFPKIKEELRKHQIAYLDTAGNIYLHTRRHHLWIEGQNKVKTAAEKVNRAFTATGLKVIYLFLTNEHLLNNPYRTIAGEAGVALGNINYIINGLKEKKFLILLGAQGMKLLNKNELLQKWMGAYEEKLKPTLHIANFRFFTNEDYIKWKNWQLEPNRTFWGGEPAGEKLTNYLEPEIFTLYTEETQAELMKKYHLIPDPNGKVKVYKKFWNDQPTFNPTVVHPLLAYTDLMNTGDRRCLETAEKIYNELLRNQFQ